MKKRASKELIDSSNGNSNTEEVVAGSTVDSYRVVGVVEPIDCRASWYTRDTFRFRNLSGKPVSATISRGNVAFWSSYFVPTKGLRPMYCYIKIERVYIVATELIPVDVMQPLTSVFWFGSGSSSSVHHIAQRSRSAGIVKLAHKPPVGSAASIPTRTHRMVDFLANGPGEYREPLVHINVPPNATIIVKTTARYTCTSDDRVWFHTMRYDEDCGVVRGNMDNMALPNCSNLLVAI
jgi:hypothetical protein